MSHGAVAAARARHGAGSADAPQLRFGTDGVRGVANTQLTPEFALAVGRAAARRLGAEKAVVARDTRISGPLLEGALVAGLASEGCDVEVLGVAPTPAVAWAAAEAGTAGVMISASHNPFADNGIKLFAPGGLKLADEAQAAFEADLDALTAGDAPRPGGAAVGSVTRDDAAVSRWEQAVAASAEGRRLGGLSVVVDCANGAAYRAGPRVLAGLGAAVHVRAADPDGTNINAGCGSTHLGPLRSAVRAAGADVGLAFDGDADRVLAVDHTGEVVDGDQLIAMLTLDLRSRGRLPGDTVVVTVMANEGFRIGMRKAGVTVVETKVGDRYVLEALESGGWALGGEQSGHVIFRQLATTGDGLLTAVQVLDLLVRSGATLRDLAGRAMTRLPQVLRNVSLPAPSPNLLDALGPAVAASEARLGEQGRVLVRPSGTEPLVRIMVEAADPAVAEAEAARLASEAERLLG